MAIKNEEYIGDGVYASFDGWYVWLRTQRDNGEHLIALEPSMFERLRLYVLKVWKKGED